MNNQIEKDVRLIESKIKALHKTYLDLKALEQTQAKDLVSSQKQIDDDFQAAQKAITVIQRNYQNRIEADKDFLAELTAMVSQLPPKYAKDYTPGYATCPQSINMDHIRAFYEMVIEDTAESFGKRLLKQDGYYDWKQMTHDFLRMAEEAELCLQKDIQDAIQASNRDVQFTQQTANAAKQQGLTNKQALELRQKQQLTAEMQKLQRDRLAFLSSELVVGFDRRISDSLNDTGAGKQDWTNYSAKRMPAKSIALGSASIKISSDSVSLTEQLEKTIKCFHALPQGDSSKSGDRFAEFFVPYLLPLSKNFKLFYTTGGNDHEAVAKEIQSIVLKKLRSYSTDSVDTCFVDPVSRGTNLGVLNTSREKNEEIGIELSNSKDDIRDVLQKLVKRIDETVSKLGKYGSVKEYNRINEKPIKETMLVVFNFPEGFDQESLDYLNTIVRNSEKAGIDIIVSSEFTSLSIRAKLDKSYLRLDWSSFFKDNWIYINCANAPFTIQDNEYQYNSYRLCSMLSEQVAFIDNYRKIYADSVKIDNTFSNIFDLNKNNEFKDATNGIALPIMIRNEKRGELCDLVLGANANSTHMLITGSTGSGKSSFLHMLITSILLNYHPDDVEFWMIDYGKVEFAQYASMRPAAIRFLSTEKSEEFTFSFLDYMRKFFEHRADLFTKEGVSDIRAYRAKCGKHSMPRVVLIIDEFHVMTQQVQQEIQYKNFLENSLTEYRKYGLSCIFSNQTLSGLIGLSETGKKQIKTRIAMMNSLDEMKLTLDVQNDNYSEEMIHRMERTSTGELWCKEQTSDKDFTINQFKAVYISDKERSTVLKSILARDAAPKTDTELHIINDSKREEIPIQSIQAKIQQYNQESYRTMPFYMGVPVTIDREFCFPMESRYNHNILVLGRDFELSEGIVEALIANIMAQRDTTLFVFADQMDETYQRLEERGFLNQFKNIKVKDNPSDICVEINSLYVGIKAKRILPNKTFILWLGYPDLFDEFKVSPDKKDVKFADEAIGTDDNNVGIDIQKALNNEELIAMAKELNTPLEDLIQTLCQEEEQKEIVERDDYCYNAIEDVNTLIQMGGKYNLFSIMTFDSYSATKRLKGFPLEAFIHKLATAMPREESVEWGLKGIAAELEAKVTAVYYDGEKARKFRPYIIK